MTGIYGSSTNFLTSNGDLTINSTLDLPVPVDNIKNITINGTVTLTGDVSFEGNFINTVHLVIQEHQQLHLMAQAPNQFPVQVQVICII